MMAIKVGKMDMYEYNEARRWKGKKKEKERKHNNKITLTIVKITNEPY